MEKVFEVRRRLDRTLALPAFVDVDSLRSRIKHQILYSSSPQDEVISGNINNLAEKRTREVSGFLDMLRSASGNGGDKNAQNEWKTKQDTEQLRVLYREGLNGSPFHTLLMEGYLEGPLDICLCVAWESNLFRKWWPQYSIPPFKILKSDYIKRVRIGEDIMLLRVKVPWPVSEREAVLHYSAVEFLDEDVVLVVLNSISDEETVDLSSHGFTRDGIPEARDVIRIDVVGGFVMQRVNENRSYFRTISNMDVKLDIIPPWLINFAARQLIGSGYKLFEKAVSMATCDEDYKKSLNDPLYARVREYTKSYKMTGNIKKINVNGSSTHLLSEKPFVADNRNATEIVEEDSERNAQLKIDQFASSMSSLPTDHQEQDPGSSLALSPEVQEALAILDSAIANVRKSPINEKAKFVTACQQLVMPVRISKSGPSTGNSYIGDSSSSEILTSASTLQKDKAIDYANGEADTFRHHSGVRDQEPQEKVKKMNEAGRKSTGVAKSKRYRKRSYLCFLDWIPRGW